MFRHELSIISGQILSESETPRDLFSVLELIRGKTRMLSPVLFSPLLLTHAPEKIKIVYRCLHLGEHWKCIFLGKVEYTRK